MKKELSKVQLKNVKSKRCVRVTVSRPSIASRQIRQKSNFKISPAVPSISTIPAEFWNRMENIIKNKIKLTLSKRKREEKKMEFMRDSYKKNMQWLDSKIEAERLRVRATMKRC